MRDYPAYLLYRAISALIAALPLPVVFRIGEFAGSIAWLVMHGYRDLALRNIGLAFGSE
jgi:lauroyl/myristoyl acyltransferase